MTSNLTSRQLYFARRPDGEPSADVFGTRTLPVPDPAEGQILCRILQVSVDPYLRLKMYDRESYTPPLQIGEAIPSRAVAQVVVSRGAGFAAGDLVAIQGGWQDYAVVEARHAERIDPAVAAPSAWLGPLGMTGFTAYGGLLSIGRPQKGETVVVSAAAGAVGSLVGQIARLQGCRTVGIAGSAEKCAEAVRDFGFDACVSYRDPDFAAQLAAACPQGIDVYFENVGGKVAATVTPLLNMFARVAVCGLISQYSGQQGSDPNALEEYMRWVLVRRLSVQGFIVYDLYDKHPEFAEVMGGWLRSGALRQREFVHEGFEAIVPAFLGMLAGQNTGKTLVTLVTAD